MNHDTELDRLFDQALPPITPPVAPGLEVNEYHMDGVLIGNADIEANNWEAIHGICAEGDCE